MRRSIILVDASPSLAEMKNQNKLAFVQQNKQLNVISIEESFHSHDEIYIILRRSTTIHDIFRQYRNCL
jgi:hypothetical protein